MRRDDRVLLLPERMVSGKRFRVSDVDAGAKQMAAVQGGSKGVGIHGSTAAHVQEDRAFLHQAKGLLVEDLIGFLCARKRGSYDVCLRKKRL